MLNYYTNSSEEITLNPEKMEVLKESIRTHLLPYQINSINRDMSSYGFKHAFERLLGFYVSNIDFKEAMKQLGIENYPIDSSINTYYKLSKRAVKELDRLSREER